MLLKSLKIPSQDRVEETGKTAGRTAGTKRQAGEMLDELHTQRDESKKDV